MTRNPDEVPLTPAQAIWGDKESICSFLAAEEDGQGAFDALVGEVRNLILQDLDKALDRCQLLHDIADTQDNTLNMVRARCVHAHALSYANQFDQSLAMLDEACELAQKDNLRQDLARAKLAKIQSLARLGRLDEALEQTTQARDVFGELGNNEWLAKAETNLGVLKRMVGQPEPAVEHFDRALALETDAVTIAQIQSNRAQTLLELFRFDQAEQAYHAAIEAFDQALMHRAGAIARGNLAELLGRQGRLREAGIWYEKVRRFFDEDQAKGERARIQAEQAQILCEVGLHEQAREILDQAIIDLHESGMVHEHAAALITLSQSAVQHNREQASKALHDAESLLLSQGNPALLHRVRLLLAWLKLEAGDIDQAQSLAELASEAEQEPANSDVLTLRLRAEIAIRRQQWDLAENLIAQALDLTQRADLAPMTSDLLHAKARICKSQGQADVAFDLIRSAIDHIERVRSSFQGDRLRTAFQSSKMCIFHDALDLALELGQTHQALEIAEQSKSRSALDMTQGGIELDHSGSSASQSPDEMLIAPLIAQRARLNAIYSRIDPFAGIMQTASAQWVDQLHDCESKINQLETRIASISQNTPYLARSITAEQALSLPDANEVIIEYACTETHIHAFVLTAQGIESFGAIATMDQVQEAVDEFTFQVSRAIMRHKPPSQAMIQGANQALEDLYGLLFAPLADAIATSTQSLTFIPSGVIHQIPLGALLHDNQHLVERFTIRRALSLSMIQATRHQTPKPGELVVGVADEHTPSIETEAHQISLTLNNATLLLGENASTRTVLDQMSQHGLIHLACHGMFFSASPMAAGLKLHDGWLTVRDIYNLNLQGSIVTLSACDSGRSAIVQGDEALGFIRAFHAAGASSIISTLWSAHDETTRKLMDHVYQLIQQNQKPMQSPTMHHALRNAQLTLIKQGTHPAYWAPFVVFN